MRLITGPFSEILTMEGLPLKGALRADQLEIFRNSWIGCENGRIAAIGSHSQLKSLLPDAVEQPISHSCVLLPGFIDAHTHICWAGSRANDYSMRLEGSTYLDIAKAGGGIWSSVTQTREADQDSLTAGIIDRANYLSRAGTTTIEVKSGYGLSIESELKTLRAIREADQKLPVDLVPTCLAAHMLPQDYDGDEAQYLRHIAGDLLPQVRKEGLADRVDIFVETSAFSSTDAAKYLSAAIDLGYKITVHGDQFTIGGSQVAIDAGAISVDHLEASTDKEIQALANSDVIATVLPAASIGLGMPFAPARKLLDEGCCVVIASDWNPGSAPMGGLLTSASILGVYEKLRMAEVLAGLTCRAAAALSLADRGQLSIGMRADMQAYPVADYREILYNQGRIKPEYVWSEGRLVAGTIK